MWGANTSGELGNGTVTPSSAPVKVSVASVTELSAGDETVCGLKDDGSVWCWGYGQSGGNEAGRRLDRGPALAGRGDHRQVNRRERPVVPHLRNPIGHEADVLGRE